MKHTISFDRSMHIAMLIHMHTCKPVNMHSHMIYYMYNTGIGLVRKHATTGTLSQTTDARRHARWNAGTHAARQSPTCARRHAGTRSWRATRHVTTATRYLETDAVVTAWQCRSGTHARHQAVGCPPVPPHRVLIRRRHQRLLARRWRKLLRCTCRGTRTTSPSSITRGALPSLRTASLISPFRSSATDTRNRALPTSRQGAWDP